MQPNDRMISKDIILALEERFAAICAEMHEIERNAQPGTIVRGDPEILPLLSRINGPLPRM